MNRTLIFAATAAMLLTACNQPDKNAADVADALNMGEVNTASSDTAEKEPVTLTGPFKKYMPWNPEGKDVQNGIGGLQYVVLKEGRKDGKKPTATDRVEVNYEGRIAATGEKFDSSYDRGEAISFRLNQVIAGWTQGVQLMSEGADYLFFIPSELGYGQNPRPGGVIKPGDDLIFRVELREVIEPLTADTAAWAKYATWNPDAPEVKKTESGLQYVVLASGDASGPSPENGEMVAVHYEGRLAANGETFDSSYERGEPAVFPSNRLIPGWVEALAMMKPGDRWMLYIPANLGYGETGTPGGPIPPNADLMFEVQMMDVMKRG